MTKGNDPYEVRNRGEESCPCPSSVPAGRFQHMQEGNRGLPELSRWSLEFPEQSSRVETCTKKGSRARQRARLVFQGRWLSKHPLELEQTSIEIIWSQQIIPFSTSQIEKPQNRHQIAYSEGFCLRSVKKSALD